MTNWFQKIFKHKDKGMSFRQGYYLTELPVCTFFQGNKKINFLLDTGSNNNLIDKHILPKINHKELQGNTHLYGLEGNTQVIPVCSITISYEEKDFEDAFMVADLSSVFSRIKQESGVNLHGIIGSNFFHKYQYVLDFKTLIAYSKK